MDEKEILLQLTNVKKYYPLKSGFFGREISKVKAVDGVTIDVWKGDSVGIVGESGCGKSTLGRTILRLEEPTSGEIIFHGEDISKLKEKSLKRFKREMQLVFQDPFASLDPRQRIGNALEEPFVIHTALSKEERKAKVLQLLSKVGLNESYYDKYPHEFSGGQRQRIGIARAITLNPKLVVCDEAVSALDVSVQAQVIKLLKEIQRDNELTYIFISHDLGVVRHFCNKVLVMYLGNMVEWAPVERLYQYPTHPYTEALLSAIPRPDPGKKKKRTRLKGDLPSPTNPPKGCPFHTRCPIATERCAQEKPEWRQIEQDHFIACHEK